ncbi:MAG TPA: hypothetical protein VKV25_08020 [Acidimicrobiales bacterium]|nr:hypothetical protein [Acidimicrobiales bacterium]
MVAVVVALALVVALLGVLVAGLLRSHADIIRALHSLGVGVGDPAGSAAPDHAGHRPPGPAPVDVRLSGPPLPAERSTAVHDLEGVTPAGDAIVVSTSSSPLTLVAFLSSGCVSCAPLWDDLGDPDRRRLLPAQARVVVVTKGPEWESPGAIAAKAPEGVPVVMSTASWSAYEVPGSPYFVLVDGRRRARVGEGAGRGLAEIADLIAQAAADAHPPAPAGDPSGATAAGAATAAATQSQATALGLNGAEREAHNDAVLRGAGILPGDPSLYPRRLEDVFASTAPWNQPDGRDDSASGLSAPGPADR